MNYRKWPRQSVLWVVTSVLLFAVLVAIDHYHWKVQGKPFHMYRFVKVVSLSPFTDDVCTSASALIPVFVAAAVVLLWRRQERLKEAQAMR